MTNQEMLIAALNGEIDDGGASWEAWIYYSIKCPYFSGDRRCHCYPIYYRMGKTEKVRFCEGVEPTRELCVRCKAEWLESEVDE